MNSPRKRVRWTIDLLNSAVAARGGRTVSNEYKNIGSKYTWECVKGHFWSATALNVVLNGSWCPYCARKAKPTLEALKEVAGSRSGTLRSTEYVNNSSKLEWVCQAGHAFTASFNMVDQGTWCPYCAGKKIWSTLEQPEARLAEIRQLIIKRGGQLLAGIYAGRKTKLSVICQFGHEWRVSYDKLKQGRWCPQCSRYLREEICRNVLREIIGVPVVKARPGWLQVDGVQLELDGYNSERRIAFEHQGQQHFNENQYLRYTAESVVRQKAFDSHKVRLCQENDVSLVHVPWDVPIRDTPKYLTNCLVECGRRDLIEKTNVDIDRVIMASNALREIHDIAEEKGGKCLSKLYLGGHEKLIFECVAGHQWMATAGSIKRGSWCLICSGKAKTDDGKIHAAAVARGGHWVGGAYRDRLSQLTWRCARGHEWTSTFRNVLRGVWCRLCLAEDKKSSASLPRTEGG